MPAQIFGTDAVVTILNRAFNDQSPSNATFNNQKAAAGTTEESQYAFAKTFGAGYAGQTADALSTLLLTNLGVLPNAALQTALKDYITSAGVSNVGIIALQLGQILSGLENATGDQAGFKAAAVAWNNEVTAAYNYSANTANTTPSTPGNVNTGATFTLTAGADTADTVGSAVNAGTYSTAGFKFTGANEAVSATGNTLLAGDSLVDGSTTDADALNIAVSAATANVGGTAGATVTNVETINIASSFASAGGAAWFDLTNVTGTKTVNVSGTGGAAATPVTIALDGGAGAGLTAIAASTGINKVDASAITATTVGVSASFAGSSTALTLIGGAGADVFVGGAAANTISGGAGNDTITGGTGADVITGGAGADVIDLGTGAIDTVIFGNTDSRALSSTTTDVVTNFQTGIDKLQFSVASSATNYSELADSATAWAAGNAAGAGALYTELATAATAALTASGTAQYVFAGATGGGYLFLDHNGDGTLDVAVALVGVQAANIARTDISVAP